MAQEIKVSVIIPVYNAEKYLRQCLDSVVGQTLREIEIILVDDGSTDGSVEIVREYQQSDSRIQLYLQEHQFAGSARNLGMSHASGEYLMFWDSDDFFELKALELLYAEAKDKDADICVCGVNVYYNDLEIRIKGPVYLVMPRVPEELPFNRQTNEDNILTFTNVTAWNKMFRKEFVQKNSLQFQTIPRANDVFFVLNALCLAEKITVIDKALVNYRANQSDSLTGRMRETPLLPVRAWLETAERLKELNAFPERSFINKAIGSFYFILTQINELKPFTEAFEFIQKTALKELAVAEEDADYYQADGYAELVRHMLYDSVEDFLLFASLKNYRSFQINQTDKRVYAAKLKKTQKKLKETDEKQAAAAKKLAETSGELEITKEKLNRNEEKAAAAEENLKKCRAKEETLEKELRAEEEKLRETEIRLSGTEEKLSGNEKKLCAVQNRLSETEGKLITAEKRVTEAENGLEEMKRQFQELQQDRDRLSSELKRAKAEQKKLKAKLKKISESKAYKIGNAVLWLPRKIRGLFRKRRNETLRLKGTMNKSR